MAATRNSQLNFLSPNGFVAFLPLAFYMWEINSSSSVKAASPPSSSQGWDMFNTFPALLVLSPHYRVRGQPDPRQELLEETRRASSFTILKQHMAVYQYNLHFNYDKKFKAYILLWKMSMIVKKQVLQSCVLS